MRNENTLPVSQRKPLAICIAALFALAAPPAIANIVPVSNCADSGAGSLRSAIASAVTGDTVSMIGLACSSISLTTGAIHILQSDLTVTAPSSKVTIDHFYTAPSDRILVHNGAGNLILNNLNVTHGYASGSNGAVNGGCIYSAGTLTLNSSRVTSCRVAVVAGTVNDHAQGGGVFSKKGLNLNNSQLSFNTAYANPGRSYGGGAYSVGFFNATDSTVSYNVSQATVPGATRGYAGGLLLSGGSTITGSTIAKNVANSAGGGVLIPGNTANYFTNSTISGNTAENSVGGLLGLNGGIYLEHTTIAFNTDGGATFSGKQLSAGFTAYAHNNLIDLGLTATIISNNTSNAAPSDFRAVNGNTPAKVVNVSGANNLIYNSVGPIPSGTINGCPLLGALKNNGGPTWTHALMSHSPAIDQRSASLSFDQRGSPFVRMSNGTADIGAFEVQQNDTIFTTEFEGCP
ncbi:hypothetical protein ELE36_08605 [Pseudolysobacter antarcticus]|uniref:Right-handed parallel beta-helix repeat-containing protein n=1 Tax=Pseudolysobacter antarcticus TaxID=2511995 RepID=A0A411HIR4_9GAMM|nr:choice-of-anchor Q domain-containing protein [Pseudolysobacter antarcticus]QBB70422.1 hypothetical protein ELE36_08605 [Pseudolysobacter antarcticus]